MIKKQFIIISFITATGSLFSQNSFSLKEAIAYGLQNHAKMENADLEIENAKQKVIETRGAGLPQVDLEGSFQQSLQLPVTVAPANAFNPAAPSDQFVELRFGTEFNSSATLKATQLIFSGPYLVGLQTASKYAQVSQLQKRKTEQDIKVAITNAYYSVLVTQESINTLDSLLVNAKDLYNNTNAIYREGLIEEDQVDQLNLSLLNTKNALDNAKRQLETAKEYLQYEMGMEKTGDITLTSNFDALVEELPGAVETNSAEVTNNIDYQLLSKQIELSQLNIKYEKSRSLPSLAAFFQHQQSAFRNEFNFLEDRPWYPSTVWGLNLSIPLFSGFQSKALINQSKVALKKNENELELLEDGIDVQLKTAKNKYQSAYDSYLVQKQSVEISKRIYERHVIKYEEGMVSSMDLTQAQSQYLNNQTNYIQSMYELINQKLELDKLTNNL